MKIYIISFTKSGGELGKKLANNLPESAVYGGIKYAKELGIEEMTESLDHWTKSRFKQGNGLVFVGATGIAVRAIAPYIVSKLTDPAVVSVDEKGNYAVPLLSGHIGGANRLAQQIAEISGGTSVISTATDINHVFAVDSWAARSGYFIVNPEKIKLISAALLAGEKIGLISEFPIFSLLPEGVVLSHHPEIKVMISGKDEPVSEKTLKLTPRRFCLGVGCRKGIDSRLLEEIVLGILEKNRLNIEHFGEVASVTLKQKEKAILDFCEKYSLSYKTYSPEQLKQVEGAFPFSEFVENTVGVGNVCQRSAMSIGDELVLGRTSEQGVTVAVSMKKWRVEF